MTEAGILGAGLVVGGLGALGAAAARDIAARPRQLLALETALQLLATEVDYAGLPLEEACRRVAGSLSGPARVLFATCASGLGAGRPAARAWHEAVARAYGASALLAQDRDILLALGHRLGASFREDQLRHVRLCQERLAAARTGAEREAAARARMAAYLGFLGGLLVVVLAL